MAGIAREGAWALGFTNSDSSQGGGVASSGASGEAHEQGEDQEGKPRQYRPGVRVARTWLPPPSGAYVVESTCGGTRRGGGLCGFGAPGGEGSFCGFGAPRTERIFCGFGAPGERGDSASLVHHERGEFLRVWGTKFNNQKTKVFNNSL